LDNFGGSYNDKFDNNIIGFYQELYYFIITQDYSEIEKFLNNMINIHFQQYTSTYRYKSNDYNNPDSELFELEYDTIGRLKSKLDQMIIRLKEVVPLNTKYFINVFTQYYIEQYNNLTKKDRYYQPITIEYPNIRSDYNFLYPKYRPIGLNKITINDGYDYIDDSNHNFEQ